MIVVSQLKALFLAKLSETGSMDAAFTKAVWEAYKAGIADERAAPYAPDTTSPHGPKS